MSICCLSDWDLLFQALTRLRTFSLMIAFVSVGSAPKKATAVGMSKMTFESGLYSLEESTNRKRKKMKQSPEKKPFKFLNFVVDVVVVVDETLCIFVTNKNNTRKEN